MLFDLRVPTLPTASGEAFPVRRIFCVGKNYADHVAEMGSDPKSTPPVFFSKPADAAVAGGLIPFPLATSNLHYEGELVVALGGGGVEVSEAEAAGLVYGYAAGCDLTRRDLQEDAKARGAPWDLAKALDHGAVVGPIVGRSEAMATGPLRLSVNGAVRQEADLASMVWSVPALLSRLSHFFELKPGDLVFTGTPAGVGPLVPGDEVEVTVADLPPLRFSLRR